MPRALRGRLDPEVGAVLKAALDPLAKELHADSVDATVGQRRADAIGLLSGRALAQPAGSGRRANRYQVVLHVNSGGLARDSDEGQAVLEASGQRVPAGTSRRIACDSGLVPIRHDAVGRVLDVGRKRRTVPPAIRRALDARDRTTRLRRAEPAGPRRAGSGTSTPTTSSTGRTAARRGSTTS